MECVIKLVHLGASKFAEFNYVQKVQNERNKAKHKNTEITLINFQFPLLW